MGGILSVRRSAMGHPLIKAELHNHNTSTTFYRPTAMKHPLIKAELLLQANREYFLEKPIDPNY